VTGPDSPINRHFTTGPIAGFLVDNLQNATAELRSAGVESSLRQRVDDGGNAWVHFRAPGRQPLGVHPGPWRLPTTLWWLLKPAGRIQPAAVTHAGVARRSTRCSSWALRATTMVEALIRTAPRARGQVRTSGLAAVDLSVGCRPSIAFGGLRQRAELPNAVVGGPS
jgi:hypothetical protein